MPEDLAASFRLLHDVTTAHEVTLAHGTRPQQRAAKARLDRVRKHVSQIQQGAVAGKFDANDQVECRPLSHAAENQRRKTRLSALAKRFPSVANFVSKLR